jgi:hypothetical protein
MEAYAFRSVSGLEASFWFDEQGGLHVDHDDEVLRQAFIGGRIGLFLGGVFLTMRKPRAAATSSPNAMERQGST